MNETLLLLFALILGLFSGFIGGIATGGGMLSIPGLMFMGLTPTTAIATTSLVSFSTVTSAFKYHRTRLIKSRQALPFMYVAFLGGTIGASLLHHINGPLMQKIFGVVCLVLSLIILLGKNVPERQRSKKHKAIGLVLTFAGSIATVLFGTGGGIFMLYIFTYLYGMSVLQANATSKIMALGGIPSSIIVFAHAGMINYHVGVPLAAGSLFGGYIGAHTAIKKGDKTVRAIFFFVATISAIKLLLF